MTLAVPFPFAPVTRTWSTVLFDLDGTLVHSAPAIVDGLAFVHRELGLPIPPEPELLDWIGPPVLESLRERAGLSELEALRARDAYREYADAAEQHVALFPGILGVLEQLSEANIPIAVATSKPELAAERLLQRLGIRDLFHTCVGANDAVGRNRKADVVGEALLRLAALGVDIEGPVMVGDRGHDVVGAAEHDVPTILVEWGYGHPREAQDALAVVASADQLRKLLLTG
ncbi:MAG: HAD hydrolase-like protein [Agromyces sp.]